MLIRKSNCTIIHTTSCCWRRILNSYHKLLLLYLETPMWGTHSSSNMVLNSKEERRKQNTREASNYLVTTYFLRNVLIILFSMLAFLFETVLVTQSMNTGLKNLQLHTNMNKPLNISALRLRVLKTIPSD